VAIPEEAPMIELSEAMQPPEDLLIQQVSDLELAFDLVIDCFPHQQKSTFLIPSYSILLHLIPLILEVRRE